jgi:hypothetical protein
MSLKGRLDLDRKFSFNLTTAEMDRLVEYADQRGSAVSWAVRELIKKGLQAEEHRAA